MNTLLNKFQKNILMIKISHPSPSKDISPTCSTSIVGLNKRMGEALTVQRITPTDVKEYKHFLLGVERRKAGTVNRRLAALAALSKWARLTKQITSDPTENIKGVAGVARGPKWLDKHEQHRLIRAIENDLELAKKNYPKRCVTRRRDASMVCSCYIPVCD